MRVLLDELREVYVCAEVLFHGRNVGFQSVSRQPAAMRLGDALVQVAEEFVGAHGVTLADTVTEDGLRLRVERDPDVLIAALLRIVQRFSSQQRKCCKLSKNIATKHAHVRLDGHVHVKADAFKGFQAMTLSQQRTEKKYGLVLSRKVVDLADPAATRRWPTTLSMARACLRGGDVSPSSVMRSTPEYIPAGTFTWTSFVYAHPTIAVAGEG